MNSNYVLIPALALAAALQGCGSGVQQSASMAQAIGKNPNCASMRDRLWSELYRQVDHEGGLPAEASVATEVSTLGHGADTRNALVGLYGQIERNVRGLDREEALRVLAEMEIGDRTTEEKAARQDELERRLASTQSIATAEAGECTEPEPGTSPDTNGGDSVALFEGWRQSVPRAVYGAYKTLSVAYQSCNVMDLRPITASTSNVSGISVTGMHPNGVGRARVVSNADAVFRTNPYYANRVSPGAGCFASPSIPLIYDYGGKPYTTSAITSTINLHKNGGSGTSALGIDCSGFVSTAVVSGGLRLRSGTSSKAYQVSGISASMFASPAKNGLSCFAPVASTSSAQLRAGDVIANTGHVVMVDRVGNDPFGIAGARNESDCANVTSKNFDFTIVQSSPSKGGIGLNRYRAADYLSGSMRSGMEAYAKSFCRVRLGLASPTTLASPSYAVVIRHTGTPSCVDQRIALEGESCMRSCAPNTLLADGR
jgi:hypothetical protein